MLVCVKDFCRRHVSARLEIEVREPLEMVLQVAVADMAGTRRRESLTVTRDGEVLAPAEVAVPGEGRAHVLTVRPGRVLVGYRATVEGGAVPLEVTAADRLTYLRPSRYAESDQLVAVAHAEFAGISGAAAPLAAVSSWVGTQLRYVPGSSGPTDGAVHTLLRRQGVCRDYAHLVVALLQALDVPARVAAVYACAQLWRSVCTVGVSTDGHGRAALAACSA